MERFFRFFILLSLFTQTAYSQENDFLSVVTSKDEIDLTGIRLVTIPTQGPFMLAGNELHSLVEDNETTKITLPEDIYIEDIVWTGDDFAIKSRHEVYMLNNLGSPTFIFDEEAFKVFSWDEQRMFIVNQSTKYDDIFMGSLKHKRVKRLLSLDEEVINIFSSGEDAMIVTATNVYMFSETECVRFINFWSPVHTAVMTSKGLVFSTEEEICILTGEDSFVLLFDSGCRQLLYDNKDFYILTNDYDLVKCNIEMLDF